LDEPDRPVGPADLRGVKMFVILSLLSRTVAWGMKGPRSVGRRLHGERGQATVEYALVILGAATVALLFVAWAASTGRIGGLLDHLMDLVEQKVG
jgi:hypothetical protein